MLLCMKNVSYCDNSLVAIFEMGIIWGKTFIFLYNNYFQKTTEAKCWINTAGHGLVFFIQFYKITSWIKNSKHHHPHYHCEEISWYSSSLEKNRLFWTILLIKILTQITPLMKWKKEKEHILTTHKTCFLQYIRLVPVNMWESRMRSRILIDIERDQEFLSIYIEQSRFFTRFIVSLCVCVCVNTKADMRWHTLNSLYQH